MVSSLIGSNIPQTIERQLVRRLIFLKLKDHITFHYKYLTGFMITLTHNLIMCY